MKGLCVCAEGPTEYIGRHNKWCADGFGKITFTDLQSTLQNSITFISALEACYYGEGTIYALYHKGTRVIRIPTYQKLFGS